MRLNYGLILLRPARQDSRSDHALLAELVLLIALLLFIVVLVAFGTYTGHAQGFDPTQSQTQQFMQQQDRLFREQQAQQFMQQQMQQDLARQQRDADRRRYESERQRSNPMQSPTLTPCLTAATCPIWR